MSSSSRSNRALRSALCWVLVLSLGCVSISQGAKDRIEAPVSCSNAAADIDYLEDEKSGLPYRAFSVVTGIFPLSAIVLILRGLADSPDGAWTDKFRVGFGGYNDDIDDKISRTRSECGLQARLRLQSRAR